MAGGGPLWPALRAALLEAGADVRESALPLRREDDPCEDLLLGLHAIDDSPREAALAVFELAEALQALRGAHGRLPRRVAAIVSGELEQRLARTLVTYLTAHTVGDDVRINVVVTRGRTQPGVDVTLALLSGLLDAARGQVLEVDP
jgi:hypothetical protein